MRIASKQLIKNLCKDKSSLEKFEVNEIMKEISKEIKVPVFNTNVINKEKILTEKEYIEILKKCRTPRQRYFMKFLYETGCRVNEMTSIKKQKCLKDGENVFFEVRGKGIARQVKIKINLYNKINALFNGSVYLFETSSGKRYQNDYISKQIKKIGKLIDRDISAHTFRHSHITNKIIKNPADIKSISISVGHRHAGSTLNYYYHN